MMNFFVLILYFITDVEAVNSDNFCWSKNYGRGVGKIPNKCGNDDKNGLLCYPKCKDGYVGVGPVCWKRCNEGDKNLGAICRRAGTVFGLYTKHSYGRSAGKLMQCDEGLENDAGLCYKKCGDNANGIGPVCWGMCNGKFPHRCGFGCATDKDACRKVILNQISSSVQFGVNVAVLAASAAIVVTTAGTASPALAAANTALRIAGKEAVARFVANQAGKQVAVQTKKQLFQQSTKDLAIKGANALMEGKAALKSAANEVAKGGKKAGSVNLKGALVKDTATAPIDHGAGFAKTGAVWATGNIGTKVGGAATGALVGMLAAAGLTSAEMEESRKKISEHLTANTNMTASEINQTSTALVEHANDGKNIDWSFLDITGVASVARAFKTSSCN